MRHALANPDAGAAASTAPSRIERRQLLALFGYSLVIWSLGNGVLPLLPIFALDFGATKFTTGLYLAASYASIAAGTLVAGWIADRFGHRKAMMVAAGVTGSPIVLVTSLATTFPQLVVLTMTTWWMGGMIVGLTSIVGGLSAGPEQRGLVLGSLAAAAPVGSILGGLGVGPLADALGFSRLWLVLGLLWLACPVFGLFVRDVSDRPAAARDETPRAGGLLTIAFLALFIGATLASTGSFISVLGRSYAMEGLHFSQAAITSTVAASGFATFYLPPVVGMLSDRLGRLRFLALCYVAGVLGLLVYASAASLPAFWVAAALVAFVSYVSTGVGSALVVDLVDRVALGRGLALFGATGWIGAILGFAAGGAAFDVMPNFEAFLLGAVVLVAAVFLLPAVAYGIRVRGGPNLPRRIADARKG